MHDHRRGALPRLTAALAATARGWPVFPLFPGSKRPAITGWQQHATTDPRTLAVWWRHRPYNIGVACGPSSLLIVDLDPPHQTGPDTDAILSALGVNQPTYTVATASGEHRYYTVEPAAPGRTTAGHLGPGIDTRAIGGYVLAAGSVRVLGGRPRLYRVVSPVHVEPQRAPDQLLDALIGGRGGDGVAGTATSSPAVRHGGPYTRAAIAGEVARVRNATPGTRNASVFTAALRLGRLAAAGLVDEREVGTLLAGACESHLGVDGFTAAEADRAVANGLRYSRGRSR